MPPRAAKVGRDPQPQIFAPVRSQTAFEETLDRLGTAIKLGLLAPGTRLPAERELCEQLGIARSTLRQALTALVQSGHLHAVRGRGGGTFVADALPPSEPPSPELVATWRDVCDRTGAKTVSSEGRSTDALTTARSLSRAPSR
jgi:DNA-binding GntR family transcriptional regulator